jgi:lipid A oxidase
MRFGRVTALLAATLAAMGMVAPAVAGDWQVSVYGGYNMSADSDVTVRYGGTSRTYSGTGWDGASFEGPPYWGTRLTYWLGESTAAAAWGVALDYSHAKVKADLSGTIGADFSHFEFTDGLNILTLNALYRMPLNATVTPYGGLGVGINVPHVETTATALSAFGGQPKTFGYAFGGPTLQAQLGLDAKVTSAISVFAEYKFDYSFVDVGLSGGGALKTDIATSQFILGASYKF